MNARMNARMNSPSFICADHICDQAFACRLSFQRDAQLALRRSHFEADISVGGEAFEKHVCLHLTSGAPRPCSLERCVFSIHFSFFCVSALLFVNLKEKAAFAPKERHQPIHQGTLCLQDKASLEDRESTRNEEVECGFESSFQLLSTHMKLWWAASPSLICADHICDHLVSHGSTPKMKSYFPFTHQCSVEVYYKICVVTLKQISALEERHLKNMFVRT